MFPGKKSLRISSTSNLKTTAVIGSEKEYVAEGHDPILYLHFKENHKEEEYLNPGIYLFKVKMQLLNGGLKTPKLYFDYGNGYSENDKYILEFHNGETAGFLQSYIVIPKKVSILRFDPSEEFCHFKLGDDIVFDQVISGKYKIATPQLQIHNNNLNEALFKKYSIAGFNRMNTYAFIQTKQPTWKRVVFTISFEKIYGSDITPFLNLVYTDDSWETCYLSSTDDNTYSFLLNLRYGLKEIHFFCGSHECLAVIKDPQALILEEYPPQLNILDKIQRVEGLEMLSPNEQLKILSNTNDRLEFKSNTEDPIFYINLQGSVLSKGLYTLEIELEEKDRLLSSPKLYYDYGHGLSEELTIPLTINSKGQIIENIEFKQDVKFLRFDPSVLPCHGVLKKFRLKKVNSFQKVKLASSKIFNGFDSKKKRNHSYLDPNYLKWCERCDTLDKKDLKRIEELSEKLTYRPKISIIMPNYNTKMDYLEQAIQSVRNQIYQNWELCIGDDASTDKKVIEYLRKQQKLDSRIKVVFRTSNGYISAASNSALEVATGEFIALMDADDIIREHTLYLVVDALNKNPKLSLLYSDEDKIDIHNNRYDPYFKPDWNLDYQYSFHYLNHFCVYRKNIINQIGGFKKEYDGSQDFDLALRVIEQITPAQIYHIPYVLYHWRAIPGSQAMSSGFKSFAFFAGLNALNDHLARTDRNAVATRNVLTTHRVFRYIGDVVPKVSIIIPTKDKVEYLKLCVSSIISKTKYANYEIVIVDNGSTEQRTEEFYTEYKDQIKLLRYNKEFNYSAINNFAVNSVDGEYICFLNNDTEVINPDWLYEMVSHAYRKEVGAVGCKLYYPNGQIQHAGVTLHQDIPGRHVFALHSKKSLGYNFRLAVTQSYLAVTGACLMVRKDKFLSCGGFDDLNLKVAYNDVDLCLKLVERGYQNIWTPFAELIHYESLSRGSDLDGENNERYTKERNFMVAKWGKYLTHDPYFNRNLSHDTTSLSFNVEVAKNYPWKN